MKTVLFVPGFREGLITRDYKSVIQAIESKGYAVTFIPITWKRTLPADWVQELDAVYSKHNPNNTILAGFSYGAMTAFISAAKRNPVELWLFSLSPYFSDDISKLEKSWLNNIGHRRVDAFKSLDFNEKVQNIKCKTLLVVGEAEAKKHPQIGSRSKLAHEAIERSRLVIAPNADHNVADKDYIAAIKTAI